MLWKGNDWKAIIYGGGFPEKLGTFVKISFSVTGLLGLLLMAAIVPFKPYAESEKLILHRKYIPPAAVSPICLDRRNLPKEEMYWLYMPETANELATNEYYGYLSGQLILSGAVDASDCPLNGLWANGYANACGFEKTREASLYLQNVYDDEILEAGKGFGVPPIMLKQLIRYESQFWPSQMGAYHFGLGHLTYLGALTSISWSRQLNSEMEGKVVVGEELSSDLLANRLLSSMNASCPTCPMKVDVAKAEGSVFYLAEVLLAYCRQTSQVVYNATKKNAGEVVDYATIWRLTLLNYNVGPNCVYNSIRASYESEKVAWSTISENIQDKYCKRGGDYVEKITAPYYDFK